MSALSPSPRIARLITFGVTCLICLVHGRVRAQEAGPQGPPEPPPQTGISGPDFSNNPYLGQRMHLDAAVHYEESALQTIWEWPATIEHWIGRIEQIVEFFEKYPNLYFIAPPPVVLEAIADHRPDLIPLLRRGIEGGRMEITGGRWCEADTQMIGEESHVRQLSHGQRFYEQTLGRRAAIAWQTEGRAYIASYPQLLRLAGMDRMFLKADGVEGDRFLWEGLDGTQTLVVNRPYPFTITSEEDDRRHKGTPPQVNAADFFAQVESERSVLPVRTGEFLGEETGRYTSHGDIKEWMRAAESVLLTAETMATIASIHGYVYPQRQLDQAWKDVLFHQQHEILGGLTRGESYEYSRVQLDSVRRKAEWLTGNALRHIAGRTPIDRSGIGVLVANALGFNRGGLAAIELFPAPQRRSRYEVTRGDGRPVANQVVRTDEGQRLLFRAE
jgi:alpha-mannosidase